MKQYDFYLMPDATNDLKNIYEYIADESGLPGVAWAYIEKLRNKCYGFRTTPIGGQKRDDLRENIRIAVIDKNAVAAFEVDEEKQDVVIFNTFYGGRDYETIILKTAVDRSKL